ncbi:hypothetical protein OPV22_009241 [Ensete ventricosum]|uniref:Membrane protein of ER body-like protein n=1 Tax=Ensete ventricosum TaxID=4639 RepID=A0AAV8RGI3_ENSVE|nr:hypothetical protein OPV22_009241 [Ensete ventricosum]
MAMGRAWRSWGSYSVPIACGCDLALSQGVIEVLVVMGRWGSISFLFFDISMEEWLVNNVTSHAAVAVETGGLMPQKDDQIATWEGLGNEKSEFKCEIINDQEDVSTEEANRVLNNMQMKNGSSSQCSSETSESEDEMAVQRQIKVPKEGKLKAVEFDLERILEEQDTHDLYCPNCNSCITKRVILRKRKRMVEHGGPSKKVNEEKNDAGKLDVPAPSGEMTNPSDAPEPDVFRCLSCFSFFMPAEDGFNIFRIFEKGKKIHGQSSQQAPEEKTNWISSADKSQPDIKEQMGPAEQLDPALPISNSGPMIQITESIDASDSFNDVRITADAGGYKFFLFFQLKLKLLSIYAHAGDGAAIQITRESDETIQRSEATTATEVLAHSDVRIDVAVPSGGGSETSNDWDVLKSIVYGGLAESIASLAVVSSAAAADASTLSIVALGLANLIGGFLLIIHKLIELRTAGDEGAGRYWELLGRKANFRLHFVVVIISYLMAGLVPPVVYGFSFRRSDNKEHKLMAVAAASLGCIGLLATGKAHVGPQRAYTRTLFHYLSLGVSVSGVSYVAGVMTNKLLEKFGLFDRSMSLLNLQDVVSAGGQSSSY